MKIQQEIDEKIKTEIRSGELEEHTCDACKKMFIGKAYEFGGKICKKCYLDAGKGLKSLDNSKTLKGDVVL